MIGEYLLKYGPEAIDSADTLADAREKRRMLIASGAPSSVYIVRPRTGSRWY